MKKKNKKQWSIKQYIAERQVEKLHEAGLYLLIDMQEQLCGDKDIFIEYAQKIIIQMISEIEQYLLTSY